MESSVTDAEHQPVLEHILAKLLMIEAVQANIIAHLAAHESDVAAVMRAVLNNAETELRVLALAEIDGSPTVAGTADRALGYLAEYSANLKAVLQAGLNNKSGGKAFPAVDPDGKDVQPVG